MTAFTLNHADMQFILRQIKIAEAHAAGTPLTEIYVDPQGNVVPAGTPGATLAIPDPLVPFGLRTVDGTSNNIVPGRETWGASDQPMPRMLDPYYLNDTDGDTFDSNGPAPGGSVSNGNYGIGGNIADADPRTISNLVVDMTLNNPAAIVAALTVAGSADPYGDMQRIVAARVDQIAADAAVAAATAALLAAEGALGTAIADYTAAPSAAAIDAIQDAAEELTAAEAALARAEAVAADPAGAQFALAQELGLIIENGSIVIPNVAPDEGLSAPFNAWMTFFGQFFDHGLDLITKGGNGTIYVPLSADDPLVTHGQDGIAGTGDELPPHLRFIAVTRATPDEGSQTNTTTPFVDQNQTYTSHASHQVFLREYVLVDGKPVTTGKLLGGAEGGLATWADVKAQARDLLGIELSDADVLNVPLLRTDPYGNFIPDENGFAQVIIGLGADGVPNTADDAVASGTPENPLVLASLNGVYARTAHAFLDDIAHTAAPVFTSGGLQADGDMDTGNAVATDPLTGQRLEYDDELLDRHYITGDGRGNENIGLTAVHHIFHSEHNRQVDSQKLVVLRSGDVAFINEWLAEDVTAGELAGFATLSALDQLAFANSLTWDGERLFQAARFATEMQYQHLVFEEFARKIQPAIDPFVFNSVTDINPAIFSEFANTVYRFGHSMLTDGMPRLDGDGNAIDPGMGLIEAFLNPVAFDLDGSISHDAGAGAVVRGMVIERGNEIDEFVVEALRNNLLGLPLDLAAINIARGRDTGIPTLNQAREQLYAATSSTFLKPYESWVDFTANLKNPASAINFIAAYGTHESISTAATLAEKRAAATLLVMGAMDVDGDGTPESPPQDRLEFLNGTGGWADRETGLNAIDLWIGGLAEKKMPFGGMLGSTFNAIFEAQLENLQDGDRFYYLTRTQGQNLLNALEQNSFAKMIMANTDIADAGPDGIRGTMDDIIRRHIGVDVFANYDFTLEVDATNQAEPDPTGNDPVLEAAGLGKVQRDDPATPAADTNFLRFTGGEHVVVGGTSGNDTIITDFGDDGIWGDAGDDRIESGAGVDLVNGGAGNDIITDSGDSGDFLKGDEGDDVIANSNGLDIIMGGKDNDVVFVGVDDTEVFGGEGNDFILGGDGVDFLLGNEGDDWIEAGKGFDTTAGDNSELFFNSAIKGHDVMFAGSDEHDFDAESGDDIMVQGESVMRNEGMFGFDWAIYKGSGLAADADLRVPVFTTEQADILRNRFDKTEALSGWMHDDVLSGDDRTFGTIAPGDTVATTEAIFFNDGLDQAGIDRVAGLAQIVAVGQTGFFESGNILLGGAGSDLMRGNGGDDILDGDRWLNVRIRITEPGADNTPANEIGTIESLQHVFPSDHGNAAWAGKSLFDLLVSRTIVPSQMHIVREIVTDGVSAQDTDIAAFNDVLANYTISFNPDGSITVTHDTVSVVVDPLTGRNLVSDGVDTLRNVEVLRFADQDVVLEAPELALNGFDSGSFADNFNTAALNNSTGTAAWTTSWVETNDSGGITTGQIRIDAGNSNTLQFIGNLPANGSNGAEITRGVDLTGATEATLTYSANPDNLDAGESVTVQFAADGLNFVTLNTIAGNGGNQSFSHTLSGPFSANSSIRFVASAITGNANEVVTVDNVAVTFTRPADPVTVDVETTFTEDGPAVAIASLPSISDDGAVIASARITLTNASTGDSLVIAGLPAGIAGAIVTAPGQIVVNLTGTATLAAYQSAIQAVSFDNNSEAPDTTDRIITVSVNDGFLDSNAAVSTVHVVAVNDAPAANNDRIVTNFVDGQPFAIPDWALLSNDTDPDSAIVIAATGGAASLTATHPAGGPTTITDTGGGTGGGTFNYTASDGTASDPATVTVARDVTGILGGGLANTGNDIVVGNGAATTLEGGLGNDIIFAGAGDDTINWNVTSILGAEIANDGRDFVDGGAGTLDRMVVNGGPSNEAFVVYAAADAAAAGITGLRPGTEIVITRNGAVIAELDNIEEITINTGPGNDTVATVGNFLPTSLNFNTITINGSTGDDTVDISALASAHRIVFRSNGGHDTIIGTLRPQDVIELPDGLSMSGMARTDNANGTTTLTSGSHTITLATSSLTGIGGAAGGNGTSAGAFTLTAADIAGLEALVAGAPLASGDDDEVPTGVRTLSGSGNNIADPGAGAADTPFIRLTEAHYGAPDAFGNLSINPLFSGLDPRTISNILGAQEADLPKADTANIFFMAFGQYFDHGLDFIGKGGNGTIQIGAAGNGAPGSGNPADLTRATIAYYEDGVPQHINKTSAYVDQNQAYGSNDLVGQFLREGDGQGGLGAHLLAGGADPSNPAFKLLPTLRELIEHHWQNNTVFHSSSLPGGQITFRDYYPGLVSGGVIDVAQLPGMVSSFMGSTHALLLDTNPFINLLDHYVVGDGRGNENVALTSMHTVWARNHNFHVDNLLASGFEGTPEEVFEAAKMLNEAEYQRVVFDEFADALLGGMKGSGSHGHSEYNPDASAGISHEFAAAVYRVGHSLIGQTMTVLAPDGTPRQVPLYDVFLNPTNDSAAIKGPLPPGYVPQPGYEQMGVSAILGGIVQQPAEEVDFNIVDAVRNDLVRINADLFAFNVARQWDVGLGTLNQVRMDLARSEDPYVSEAAGFAGELTPYTSWEDFQSRNGLSDGVIAQFKQAYPDLVLAAGDIARFREINPDIAIAMRSDGTGVVKGIDRVDLWVGGLAEKHINGGVVGQTFWVVLHEQFDRLQEADRFYYTDRFDNFDFYETFIDGQSFADIVARTTGLTGLPERIFEVGDADAGPGAGEPSGGEPQDDGDSEGEQTGGIDPGGGEAEDEDEQESGGEDNGGGEPAGGGEDDDQGDDSGTDASDGSGDDNADDEQDDDSDPDGDDAAVTPPPGSGGLPFVIYLGTAANDTGIGRATGDTLSGEDGDDTLLGLAGNDNLVGGAGDDKLLGDSGDDIAVGGAGDDTILGGEGDDTAFGDAGDDVISGDGGDDVLFGGAGRDVIDGNGGNDTIRASTGDGDDAIDGGDGIDTLDLRSISADMKLDLGASGVGFADSTATGHDTLSGIENVKGGSGSDTIVMSAAVNVVEGGGGADTFVFPTVQAANGDAIADFEAGDKIDLRPLYESLNLPTGDGFALVPDAAFTATGQIRLHVDNGDTIIQGNTDNDQEIEFSIKVQGRTNLTQNDFS